MEDKNTRMLSSIKLYLQDYKRYSFFTKKLVWFKKNKGLRWIKGQNFGDYLSQVVVSEFAMRLIEHPKRRPNKNLLAIGSILHLAKDDDVVWGSGVNGKMGHSNYLFGNLDVRCVRGPITKEFLENRGVSVPERFGDPALLLPLLFPDFVPIINKNKVTVIPNLNELHEVRRIIPREWNLVSPLNHWSIVLQEILTSEIVLSSSLHGIILAEAWGIPVRFYRPFGGETMLKYEDYLLGTCRTLKKTPTSLNDNPSLRGGVELPPLTLDTEDLQKSFPLELFK